MTDYWTINKVEYREVDSLLPYAKNSRTHSPEQISQIAASIREFGWTNPILVDGANGIIAGHGRILAARKLGMDKVPVIELAHLSESQKRAYIIADNKLALNAGWDNDILKLEICDLSDFDSNLELTGFSQTELSSLLGEVEEGDAESLLGSDMEYRIIIDCRDESQQTELLDRFDHEGLTCRPLIS